MSTPPPAYAVPFWLDRSAEPHIYRLVNMSDETLHGLTVSLLGSGHLVPMRPGPLLPGRELHLTTLGLDSRDSVAVVRWFGPDDQEYLWRFAF